MRSVKRLVAAGAASLLSSVAVAADMAIMPSPMYAPPPVEDFGGWYLRGDIGFSNQRVNRLNNALDAASTSSVQHLSFNTAGIDSVSIFSACRKSKAKCPGRSTTPPPTS